MCRHGWLTFRAGLDQWEGNPAASGGGISCGQGSPRILGCTICGNSSDSLTGGGIYCSPSATIANTIVAYNSSGIFAKADLDTLAFRSNCVYGNTFNYVGLPDPTGADGNISGNPKFVLASSGPDGTWATADDVFGDLRLLPGSPCIDAGRNADVGQDTIDLDGDGNTAERLPFDLAGAPRLVDDVVTPDTGSGTPPIVDIGAYERCRPVGDVNGDWTVDTVDLLHLVDAFGSMSGDPNYDPRCDFNNDGAVDVVDLLILVENFGR